MTSTEQQNPEGRSKYLDGDGYWMGQRRTAELHERSRNGLLVVSSSHRQWEVNPMGMVYRYIYEGLHDDTALSNWWIFAQQIRQHTGSHRHQGGLLIFVLEGSGYSLVDGVRCEWEAGDLLLLPIVRGGGPEHQHFNNPGGEFSKWVAFIYLPFRDGLGTLSILTENGPLWNAAGKGTAVGIMTTPGASNGAIPTIIDELASRRAELPSEETPSSAHSDTLLGELLRRRDQQRVAARRGQLVIHGRDRPWEENELGRMRWYQHPSLTDQANRSFIVYLQELRPGERSGRIRTFGDEAILIVRGTGYSVVDGVEHRWQSGDMIGLPVRPAGIEVQHVAEGDEPMQLLSVRPNLIDALNVDRGCGFDILEAASSSGSP